MAYNVLIVDDSSIVRKVLIKAFGMTCLPVNHIYEAENGQVALDKLSDTWIDIIFLDINMPVMNGMQFIERVRTDEKLSATPIIVVSTEGSKERREELLKGSVKAYLRKPVTPEQLVSTIEEVLGKES